MNSRSVKYIIAARIVRQKFEAFERANPEPDFTPQAYAKLEAKKKAWRKRRDTIEREVIQARDKFFDRVVFDHENAMLLLKDFEAFEPGKTGK